MYFIKKSITIFSFIFLISPLTQAQNMTVKDVGVIGLFSHDVFTWNHRTRQNEENGIVDLSTIFDYDNGNKWETGGNPKNSENAPVYSITMDLVDFFKERLEETNYKEARKQTVAHFISLILDSYQRLTGHNFDEIGLLSHVNNTEQAVLRSMHDILPGWINLYRNGKTTKFKVTNVFQAKTRLNQKELNQPIRSFDGDYDPEYLKIDIVIRKLNLKKIDKKFIEEFSQYKQADMLAELKNYGEGHVDFFEISFSHHLVELLQKSLCSEKSEWLPERLCQQ